MIPAVIDPQTASPGEREVFQRLRDDPDTNGWIVLHSLVVSHHLRQLMGEVDFVVIVPGKGALGLEVKACRSLRRTDDGLWYYGRDPNPDPRGPFRQAADGTQAVRAQVQRHRELSRVLFWSAVVFPYIPFHERSGEWHSWQVVDGRAFRSKPLSQLLVGVLDAARSFVAARNAAWFDANSGEPTPEQCAAIARLLRPSFEVAETPKVVRGEREQELLRYTEEQFEALDAMERNKRVAFEGPAGTGKTLLALEAARRSALEGRRTLLLCFNRLLGDWLREQAAAFTGDVDAGTLHSLMLRLAREAPPENAGARYWETELPAKALEALVDEPEPGQYEELVIDEGQDILRDEYLDVLDLILTGGLAAGRWRLFGDFERQALYGSATVDFSDFLATRSGGAATFCLGANCRNTPRIASLVPLLAGLDRSYARILRPDDGIEPRLRYYKDGARQCELLAEALEELRREGFSPAEIVVLSPSAREPCAERLDGQPWRDRLRPISRASPGSIRYSTIHAFKGLESPAVVVTDITTVQGEAAEALLYVAITRATDRLVLLLAEPVRAEIAAMLTRPALEAQPI